MEIVPNRQRLSAKNEEGGGKKPRGRELEEGGGRGDRRGLLAFSTGLKDLRGGHLDKLGGFASPRLPQRMSGVPDS